MKTYVTDNVPSLLQRFISDYSIVYHKALVDTVNHRLSVTSLSKSELNTYLQHKYQINKRHANAVITEADGMISSARECRENHIKQLESKLKSAIDWLSRKENYLNNSRIFYQNNNWRDKNKTPRLRLACNLKSRKTTWQTLRFTIHQKKRYIAELKSKINRLRVAPIRVTVPRNKHAYFVGSKGEKWGNQVCQFDGKSISIRVPHCLEDKYGEYVTLKLEEFPYGHKKIDQALNTQGKTASKDGTVSSIRYGMAMTYRFFAKDFRWFIAVSFDLPTPKLTTKSRKYGCIGINLNPGSISWTYVDYQGNLKAKGQIPLHLSGKRRGQAEAIIGDAISQLTVISNTYGCPIVCESLDFSRKKADLRERGRKYARMLSHFTYSRFFAALSGRCYNFGIELIQVNPVYTSLIALVKYVRMYGLGSDEAVALSIARRAMGLSERLPRSITALLQVNCSKHVWSGWHKLNTKLAGVRHHTYYSISNWEPLLTLPDEDKTGSDEKPTGGKGSELSQPFGSNCPNLSSCG